MRHSVLLVASLAAALISVAPAGATMRITGDRGGLIISYAERFMAARASGESVVIDGACLSACTLAVGILPRGQICAAVAVWSNSAAAPPGIRPCSDPRT